MSAFTIRLFACAAALSCVAGASFGDEADPFADAYDRAGAALDSLGDASVSLRQGDRSAVASRLGDAAGVAEESLSTLWSVGGPEKRSARRLRPYGRRFVYRVLDAQAAVADGAVDDARLAKSISRAIKAGTTLTKGFVRTSHGSVALRAATAGASVAGIWTGTYDSTNGAVDNDEWWAVVSVSKGVVTATWNALSAPLGSTNNANSKAITMHGWVSGKTLYLSNDSNASVILRATITGTTLSGNYIQSGGVLFNVEEAGTSSYTDGTLTGSMF